jgi:MFS family permease
MIVGGWLCCIIGLVGASFAQTVPVLILTQGVVYGVGVLTYYHAQVSMLNEWFDKRRGLAYGIIFGANGLSGVALPYIMEKLLSRYGYATTLRCYAIGAVLITLPALFCLRGRLPYAPALRFKPQSLLAVFQKPKFWSFAISSLLQGVASSIPSIFLPTFASSLSLPQYSGPLLLAMFNLFQAFSDLGLGYLSDKLSVSILLFFSSFLAGIFTLLLWGLAPLSSQPLSILVVFAALYGAAAGGYSALYPRMATALTPEERTKKTLYGVWCLERGVGNVLAGLLSGVLVSGRAEGGLFGAGRFEGLVVFTGACLVLSAVAVLGNLAPEWRQEKKPRGDLDES